MGSTTLKWFRTDRSEIPAQAEDPTRAVVAITPKHRGDVVHRIALVHELRIVEYITALEKHVQPACESHTAAGIHLDVVTEITPEHGRVRRVILPQCAE